MKTFYENLYKNTDSDEIIEDKNLQPTQLTNSERTRLDLPLTKQEIDRALTQQKNNKSPGLDGYSAEFFKKFWGQLGYFFTECVNECYNQGKLTPSQLTGLITCLPKTGKARNLLKNWRPISLLNTTYKIISLCITNRLRPILDRIISHNQKGFLQGRTISDCTRVMYDIIWDCEHNLVDGLILLVDFQKAFDSLSWKFIHETLKKFNFGENFVKWISMFQENSNSCIILNGYLSDSFYLHRGCRQGDPISPYLFILCTEFLTLAFNTNPNIEGITIKNREHKTSLYADDTSIFLKATERNLRESLQTLTWFYQKSGLKINFSKTKVIKLGPIRETDRRFCRENDLDWVSSFTALGITYDVKNIKNITVSNIESKLDDMKKIIQLWMYRNITPIGRICVAKSLILSKVIHVLQSLPTPPSYYLKKIEKLLIDFVWKNKRHEINKKNLYLKYDMGGLNMVNIEEFDLGLKLTWVRKTLQNDTEWKDFALEHKIDRLPLTGQNYHQEIYLKTHNPFWKSVIMAYKKWNIALNEKYATTASYEYLWGNPRIKIPFNNTLYKANIIYAKDLYNHDGAPLSKLDMEAQIGKSIMLTTYFSLWKALPGQVKIELNGTAKTQEVFRPIQIEWLCKDKKGTQSIRKIWESNIPPEIPSQTKWVNEPNMDPIDSWKPLYLLPIQSKLNARCKYFQFQILHRTLVTNRKLKMFNIRDDEICDNCHEVETISHLLFECHVARNIWREIQIWLSRISPNTFFLDKKSVLLGNTRNEIIINYIITLTKHELYKSKWNRNKLTLAKLKHTFKQQMDLEIYLGTIKNTLPKVLGKWATILNDLRTL